MRKRIVIIMILCLVLISILLVWWMKGSSESESEILNSDSSGSEAPDSGGNGGEGSSIGDMDEQDYGLKVMEMDGQEQDETIKKLFSFMESCEEVYGRIADAAGTEAEISKHSFGGEGDVVEDALYEMIEIGAAQGLSVTCGSRDYNLTNYRQVDDALRNALAGKDAETEFFQVNSAFVFRYYHLTFVGDEMMVTSASAMFGDSMEPALQQLEKIQAYRWEYTKKGWLIWEKALSRNQEMDMHIFSRVLPLEEQCREIAKEYVEPVSYFCNNLFLVDWDMSGMDKIEFNDLFEFLYAKENGKRLEEEVYADGIPKEEFESVIGKYFDISVEEMERYGRYNGETGRYPWSAIGIRNRVQQLQPSFPEVVRCVENGDGTVTAYVEAVSVEEGLDCYYAHEVTLRRKEDGSYVYVGNRVNREQSFCIPAYRARREFEGMMDYE